MFFKREKSTVAIGIGVSRAWCVVYMRVISCMYKSCVCTYVCMYRVYMNRVPFAMQVIHRVSCFSVICVCMLVSVSTLVYRCTRNMYVQMCTRVYVL